MPKSRDEEYSVAALRHFIGRRAALSGRSPTDRGLRGVSASAGTDLAIDVPAHYPPDIADANGGINSFRSLLRCNG